MNDLLERLRQRHWRLTAQRRVVAQALDGENVHLTADEVLARAKALLPEISRATVYNTLNELVEMGEVAEVAVGRRAKRYDPNVRYEHQHLLCVVCGSLDDVQARGLDDVGLAPGYGDGFELGPVDLTFRGVCPSCRSND